MKLIKEIPSCEKWPSGFAKRLGVFQCPHCKKEVVRLLNNGARQKSCGCFQASGSLHPRFKHGEHGTRIYGVWKAMHSRCRQTTGKNARFYNERGITVCRAWSDAGAFIRWAKRKGYRSGLLLDRKNNDAGYSPRNCRFVTPAESTANTRRNRAIAAIESAIVKAVREDAISKKAAARLFCIGQATVSRVLARNP